VRQQRLRHLKTLVLSFSTSPLPPGAVVKDIKLDAAERQRVIDGTIANLQKYYVRTIDPTQTVGLELNFRQYTGGFNLLSVTHSEPWLVKFRLKERNSPTEVVGSLRVKETQPLTMFRSSPGRHC